jgi:superfamily II DNA or RNA helicase
MATASSDDFLEFLGQAESPVLIADEAHRIGSPGNRRILESILFEERLGLSATPERLFDSEGQEALEKAFGTNPVYNLPIGARVKVLEDDPTEAPIIGRFLSKYDYYFEVVRLTPDEQQEWDRRTLEIRRFYAKNRKSLEHDNWNDAIGGKLQHLLIQRARILKRAREKVDCACKVVTERYPKNGRWIVYCEDGEQLRSVTDAVRINNRRTPVLTYYSGMNPTDRDRTLQYFEQQPCIIVSIRCLDEGVDIPNIDGALILASSKNPREYIQRRGRVLRKSIGKRKATIVDAIVLPSKGTEKGENVMPIVKGESLLTTKKSLMNCGALLRNMVLMSVQMRLSVCRTTRRCRCEVRGDAECPERDEQEEEEPSARRSSQGNPCFGDRESTGERQNALSISD